MNSILLPLLPLTFSLIAGVAGSPLEDLSVSRDAGAVNPEMMSFTAVSNYPQGPREREALPPDDSSPAKGYLVDYMLPIHTGTTGPWGRGLICTLAATLAESVPFSQFLGDTPAPKVVTYGTVDSVPLTFALFTPPDWKASDKRPTVVFIHGGGWAAGDGRVFYPHARYFASRGAVALSIEYRLEKQDGSSFQNCFSDAQSAMRYVRGHAADLGINPDEIAVFGDSAGGHLAAALGACTGFNNSGDDLKISAVPNALVLCNPIVDMTEGGWIKMVIGGKALARKPDPADLIPTPQQLELARALSPLYHIKPGEPPALLIHGTDDKIVHPLQAQEFADAYKKAGNRCDLVWMQGQGHAFVMVKYRATESVVVSAINRADAFLGSLGWLHGAPTLEASDPPDWTPRK